MRLLLAILVLLTPLTVRAQAIGAEVRAQVESGDDAAALAALGEPAASEPAARRYLRGRLLERLGREQDAAEAFGPVLTSDLPAWVRADAGLRRARVLAMTRACDEADAALAPVTRRRDAELGRALVAQCRLAAATDEAGLDAAIVALRAVVAEAGRDVDTFAARQLLAEALRRRGDDAEADRLLRELYVQRPAHPDAVFLPVPTDLSVDETLARADRLVRKLRAPEAVAMLEGGPPAGASRAVRARWAHSYGMALYKTRHHYAEAAVELARAARLGSPSAAEDAFHAARALSRADQDAEAIRAYRRFARQHRRHRRAAEAEYLAAWLELRVRPRAGRRAFEQVARRSPDTSRRANALWHLGMGGFDAREFVRAAGYFERYAGGSRDPMRGGRGLYWAGRAFEAAGRDARAKGFYRRVHQMAPLHWYGLHAGERLRGLGESPSSPLRAAGAARPLPAVRMPADVALLLELGLIDDARRVLARHASRIRDQAPAGRRGETLVAAYQQVGDAHRAFRIAVHARDELGARPEGDARWAWEAAYPRPHEEVVRREAARHGIPWEHVYATMRQESQYEAHVVSRADAIGLLQLLPSSAQTAARRLRIPYSRDRLFDPEWNIRYGLGEMVGLWRRFDRQLPYVVAAYNAGAARVDRWRRELGTSEVDLFVERIPFDETRNYVRRVLSHFARYRYMHDPEAPLPFLGAPAEQDDNDPE